MSKLLRFLVDHKLQEEVKPLTAYAVAVDALGRDDGFDTQVDSYPRVQIGRLRRMLDHFYLRENSEKRLSIPFHDYEIILGSNDTGNVAENLPDDSKSTGKQPIFPTHQPFAANKRFADRTPTVGLAGLLVILVVVGLLAVGAYFYRQQSAPVNAISYPAIIVKGSEGIVNSSSGAKIEIVESYLVGRLAKFDQVRVYGEDARPKNLSQYLIESSILNAEADLIQLRLVDSATREVIWSRRIAVTTIKELEADLDKAVVDIARPYGKITQHELSKYRGDFTPGYPCLLQFQQYMRYRDTALLVPTLQCMERSAREFPNDAYLMSMLAVAKYVSEQFDVEYQIDGLGRDFALKAARLDQSSASATFAVAQSAFFESDCQRGVGWGERAVELNPLNSRIMGYLGIYMLACNMPEGETYSTKALQMDPDADLAIVAALAIQKLRRGEVTAAHELALKYMDTSPGATPGLEISYILSSAMMGNKKEARRVWRRLAKRSGLPETAPPREVLGKWIANPDLIRELESDFKKARLY